MPRYDIYRHVQRPCNQDDSSFACGEISAGLSVSWRIEAGLVVPIRFGRTGAEHEVAIIDDRWPGADHLYVKVGTQSGDTYILRHDGPTNEWEITLFKEAASFKGGSADGEGPELRGSPPTASQAVATVGWPPPQS
jgi:hypothetical protein